MRGRGVVGQCRGVIDRMVDCVALLTDCARVCALFAVLRAVAKDAVRLQQAAPQ